MNANTNIKKLAATEEALRLATDQLELAFKNVPAAIYLFDRNGKILMLNDEAVLLNDFYSGFAYANKPDVDEYHNKIWDLFELRDDHGEPFQVENAPTSVTLRTGIATQTIIHLIRKKDNKHKWILATSSPLMDDKGDLNMVLTCSTDITLQKEAEKRLRQSEEKLEFLIKKRTSELERSNEDLLQFAHVASHDLKEPLRKIKIFSSLLEDEITDVLSTNAKLYLGKIHSATDRMFSMMEGVLRYAGLDGYDQLMETIDLNTIIKEVETDLEVVIGNKKAIIKSDPLPMLRGFRILIYQVFYNLISNSLKFSRSDIQPLIQIRHEKIIREDIAYAQITIKDNGIGFEQQDAEKIFHSFSRLHAKDAYEGTGLGLSLCRKIVTRHQGIIKASGQLQQGAVFVVQFPLEPVMG